MEEEDTYGFGSFSELFDAGASSQKQKRLDLGALSRFCMSERLLSRFQQQQRRDKRYVMFQHVAAKFDGVGIDGGLGALGVAALEGGGVVWLQTAQSDSDALERRKKELRDITNRAPQETKSAAALFVALTHVASVQPTTVQNTVQGVELKLTDGNRLELTFMPGPFAGAAHRDEFLQVLKKCMAVAAASTSSASVRTSATTSCAELEAVKSGSGEPKAAAASETTGAAQKEEFRQLVRRYINVDPLSEEGVEIAKQVHAGTGYLLGPTMKQPPKFSADAEYRKKTVSELAEFLKRMNKEWSDADAHRELHTKAKHSRNEDGLFEYTDTVTGAQIPPRVYEERYLEYVKAHDVNPVLHLFPVEGKVTRTDKAAQNDTPAQNQPPPSSLSTVTEEEARDASSFFMATLGVDISSSSIINNDFFSAKTEHITSPHNGEDQAFREAVDSKRTQLWKSWGSTFARVGGGRVSEDEPRHRTNQARSVSGATRKRSRGRRQSLVMPSSDELQATIDANVSKSSKEVHRITSGADSVHPGVKRSRATSQKLDTAQKSRRKARRQSIVGTVSLPSTLASEDEHKKTPRSRKSPHSARKSPRPRHPANGYARETSALEMVGDEDSDLCRLCYNEQARVLMDPCAHVVCASCWSRLSPSTEKSGSNSKRVCPWDREVVTKR